MKTTDTARIKIQSLLKRKDAEKLFLSDTESAKNLPGADTDTARFKPDAALEKSDCSGGKKREEIEAEILADFETRRNARKAYELAWQLDMNFVMGNQYCAVSPRGAVEESDKLFFWQEREVYNHLAPILETRLAKLSRVRPKMSVVPFSGDDADIMTAKTAGAILDCVTDKLHFDTVVSRAAMWSETTGTVFYKVLWTDGPEGGDVSVEIVPPFEIFPDSDCADGLEGCASLIHARAYPVGQISDRYGVECSGEDIDVFTLDAVAGSVGGLGYSASSPKIASSVKRGHAMVIEYYERPSSDFPDGRLAILAGGKLVYLGALPYKNGTDGGRDFPFVRQTAIEQAGIFWGTSVIERAIPVQRAYNAVKNRKHEFLNRIAMGVLTVEDGSVDTDNLAEEGLSPGKIIVYRQGSSPPTFMDTGRLPSEFGYEEDKLLAEFISISGVSEIMRSSSTSHSANSGVALQLLIEQDDTRLSVSAELIKAAVKRVAAQILRLYKQYVDTRRIARIVGSDGAVEVVYWTSSDITSDDVVFVSENQLSETPAQKQNFVFELLKTGLLQDENGKMSDRMRTRVLDLLGFGMWQSSKDLESLHIKRAMQENLSERTLEVYEVDDHRLHIAEHTKYLLGGEIRSKKEGDFSEKLLIHIREHKTMESLSAQADALALGKTQTGGRKGGDQNVENEISQ